MKDKMKVLIAIYFLIVNVNVFILNTFERERVHFLRTERESERIQFSKMFQTLILRINNTHTSIKFV